MHIYQRACAIRPSQGGTGHVNCHSPAYLQQRFEDLGYVLDGRLTRRLRNISEADRTDGDVSKFLAMRRRTPVEPCGRPSSSAARRRSRRS